MIGKGLSFKERHQERVLCPEYGKEVSKGSLVAHHQNKHGVTKDSLVQECDEVAEGDNPSTYRMEFTAKSVPRPCLVEGVVARRRRRRT